jgi:hypothetical protein
VVIGDWERSGGCQARQLKVASETEAAHDFDGGLATALVGRVSPRPQDRGRDCTLLGREPSRAAKAFALTGRSVAVDPAVSERRALPPQSPPFAITSERIVRANDPKATAPLAFRTWKVRLLSASAAAFGPRVGAVLRSCGLRGRTKEEGSGYALNVCQRLGQVRAQIFDIFHTNRETNETVIDPKLDTLFGRNRSVSHQCRMFDQAFHSTEAFGQRK